MARQAEILAVCPEDAAGVAAYWQREKLPFVGLADPGHEVANQYGQEVNLLKLGRMPALAVVDRNGAVRYEHHAFGMHDIPPNSQILALLDALNGQWSQQTDRLSDAQDAREGP